MHEISFYDMCSAGKHNGRCLSIHPVQMPVVRLVK